MKAIVWTHYGPPEALRLAEVAKPIAKDNQVLIKVHAASVSAGDCEIRRLKFPLGLRLLLWLYIGIGKPKRLTILGQEIAGEVVEVGKEVKKFKPGDAVFAATGLGFGGYAEYRCLPETSAMAHKPLNMTYQEAAAVPVGGLEALYFLAGAKIQPGQRVLINGAGGSIGTIGVQLAKHYGALVTAVDIPAKLEMLRSIGADSTVDCTQEDFSQSDQRYDVIFDVTGKSSFSRCMGMLEPNGRYLLANAGLIQTLRGRWIDRTSDKKVICGTAASKAEDLLLLKGLIEAGKIRAVIDRVYPLEQVVQAHHYVESGQKKGNVVMAID